MAKDSKGKEHDRDRERELQKRLNADGYMLCAVKECYASCKNIFDFLILGELDKSYVNHHLGHFLVNIRAGIFYPFTYEWVNSGYVLYLTGQTGKIKRLAQSQMGQK